MAAQNLVPVFTGSINNETTLLCDARLLHGFLRVGRRFATWIVERITEYGFVENQDYVAISQKREIGRGRGRTDYHLTLDTAKELAMVERNDQGRAVRRYFIECEKQLRQQGPAKTTADERSPLRAAVSMLVGKRALMYPEAYALVHQRFGVQHIDELPSAKIPEAIEYVHRLALEGEWLPPASTAPECYPLSQHEAVNLSALFSCVDRMRELLQRLEPPLRQMDSRMAPAVYDGWHEVGLPLRLLGELREHADTAYRQCLLQRPACP